MTTQHIRPQAADTRGHTPRLAAPAAGCRSVDIDDPASGDHIALKWLYPSDAPAQPQAFGPYVLDVAMDAEPSPVRPRGGEGDASRAGGEGDASRAGGEGDAATSSRDLRLVVISHGNGGSALVHRDLALHLARSGWVVALIDHPGNCRTDNSRAGTAANLVARPQHVKRCLDASFDDAMLGPRLRPGRAAVIGHSIGGATALSLAGGRATAFAHEAPDGQARELPVLIDERVAALVLLAPATVWFAAPQALAAVRVPVLMRSGEHDPHTPDFHADVVRTGLPAGTPLDHRVVPGAGHFSFQSPFPAAMQRADFPPAHDPPGFDRAAYQSQLIDEVQAFLDRALPD